MTFETGDIVVGANGVGGLAVVVGLYADLLVEVTWVILPPGPDKYVYREAHAHFDIRTHESFFTKIGALPWPHSTKET